MSGTTIEDGALTSLRVLMIPSFRADSPWRMRATGGGGLPEKARIILIDWMQSSHKAEAEEEYEEFSYHPVDALQSEGVNAADITKLKAAGLNTVGAVVMW